uniref:Ig-like domain-containing protein n=1 Tax=Leptobrachium leishanense TaxID=445787 RepID=A0A8C5QXC0_9ANUR
NLSPLAGHLRGEETNIKPTPRQRPQEILYVEANQQAEISCRSREAWLGDNIYSWYYRKTWGETPTLLIHCKNNPNPNNYSCVSGDLLGTGLRIHSARAEDSGIYHCVFCIRDCEFGNGTMLITRGKTTSFNQRKEQELLVKNVSENPNGTGTFLNHISIPRHAWDRVEGLSCDVWTHSSVYVHREIPETGNSLRNLLSLYKNS